LREPPKQPAHRKGRCHQEFVANVPMAVDEFKKGLSETWGATRPLGNTRASANGRGGRRKAGGATKCGAHQKNEAYLDASIQLFHRMISQST
jgi:hypothetical protein